MANDVQSSSFVILYLLCNGIKECIVSSGNPMLFAGFNRVIGSDARSGSGLCSVTISLGKGNCFI